MPSGTGATGLSDQVLYQGFLTDTRLVFRWTGTLPVGNQRLGVLFISLGYSGSQYLWRAYAVYAQNRLVAGIPESLPGGGKRIVLRPDIPDLAYSWETLA